MEETKGHDVSSGQVVERYIDMVYRLALSQTKSKTDADDIVQNVFLKYLQSKKKFESEEHIKAWLIRVTVNSVKSFFASSWFQKTAPISEDIAFETQEQGEAYYAVMELPKKYRTVIHLFYYEEMSVSEISSALGISEGTIKSQLHRGRELLKNKLKGGGELV